MLGTYTHKFVLDNGRQVFVPSAAGRQVGAAVHKDLLRRWWRPNYFYHLRSGGHLAALRVHRANHIFGMLDISGFFDSVTRTKVHRTLRSIGFSYHEAWKIACEGTVEKTKRARDFSVPYGFIQSPVLASAALDRSALGSAMKRIARSNHTRLSCYMDDILVSGTDQDAVENSHSALLDAAGHAGFKINRKKLQPLGPEVTAFNIILSHDSMVIADGRLRDFEDGVLQLGPSAVSAIIAYVKSANRSQGDHLIHVAATSADPAVRDLAARLKTATAASTRYPQ